MSLTLSPDSPTDTNCSDTATGGTLTDTRPGTGSGIGIEMMDADAPALSSYARCADGNGTLSFLFFSEDDLELARAKAICRTCGLQEQCLTEAIEREEPYGVWGGKLVLDGVPVEFKRKRGRPPKHPLPILVVDEAPLPPHLVA